MGNIDEAIEQLQCAEINCDNVARIGWPAAKLAKMQIQEAIKLLGGEPIADLLVRGSAKKAGPLAAE